MANKKGATKIFVCSSRGPRNNGIVAQCTFEEEMADAGYIYHCPTCGAPLKIKRIQKRRKRKK